MRLWTGISQALRSVNVTRFGWRVLASGALVFLVSMPDAALGSSLRIRTFGSPKNRERPLRKSTRFIVLHTTEGAERGALHKLSRDGEAHYLVGRTGLVHRIVDKRKVAFHAGLSMWNGTRDLDRSSIAVEVAGYHHRAPNRAQLRALKELLRQLKSIYGIPDERVLTHSMVAYGAPNRWHRHRHRGRKRCGMKLGSPSIRKAMGLNRRPLQDPDVSAGRLMVADKPLFRALFPPTAKVGPRNTRPSLQQLPPKERKASTTIFLFPDGMVRTGAELAQDHAYRRRLQTPPQGTQVLVGYTLGGYVKAHRPPSVICGALWNQPSTFYRFPDGKIRTGDEVRAHRIPQNTLVFFRHPGR